MFPALPATEIKEIDMTNIKAGREFLKDTLRKKTDFYQTDQNKGIPAPPLQKPFDPEAPRIKLALPEQWSKLVREARLDELIAARRSRRKYSNDPLLMEELSFLIWATQGIRRVVDYSTAYRHVPSAGARHSFETYIFARKVQQLDPGVYRFLPLENELLLVRTMSDIKESLSAAAFGQRFIGQGSATFVWSCIPYRMEWRYGRTAYRVILMDLGHVCQNLYLACEALGAGTCAVAAYDQEAMDELLGLDGQDEFVVYLAPVGKALQIPDVI